MRFGIVLSFLLLFASLGFGQCNPGDQSLVRTSTTSGPVDSVCGDASGVVSFPAGTEGALSSSTLTATGAVSGATYLTATRCADSAGAAACVAAPAGSVVVDAAATSVVVSTTAVTANSQIFVMIDASLGTLLSVTCNTQAGSVFNQRVTARTAATSFTVTVDAGPTTDPLCLSYFIVN